MIIQPVYKMIYISCEFYYEHLTVKQHVDCKDRNSIHGTGIKYFVKKKHILFGYFYFSFEIYWMQNPEREFKGQKDYRHNLQ